jgi:hypothetical protein
MKKPANFSTNLDSGQKMRKNVGKFALDGGVAQWTSHPPEELQTRVRFTTGCKVFKEIIAMLLCKIDFICIVCVSNKINKGIVI